MSGQTEREHLRAWPRAHLVLRPLALLLAFFLGPLCFASTVPQQSAARGECLSLRSQALGRAVPYCVLLPPGYDADKTRRYPVLYYLHGLGDNEQMFFHSGGWELVERLWENHEIGDFVIVTPAAYATFYINSHDGTLRYEDFFLREFLPAIENRYRIASARRSRGIAGISMGGYGALRLAFLHPELFGSVSAHSAALIETLPAVAVSESSGPARLRILGTVFGTPPDRAFWDRNNPLKIARTAALAGMKIYFDCGSQDDYGFEAGAQALHTVLQSRGVDHTFHLYSGGHNWAYFAEHLPDSLRFHSGAFAAAESKSRPPR
jgi:S-formylglutathione hydrolase FrmB